MQSKPLGIMRISLVLLIGIVVCLNFYSPSGPLPQRVIAESGIVSKKSLPGRQVGSGLTRSSQWYKIARVVDGDTVVLDMHGVSTTVRLIGLDTPEVVDPKKPVQCYGPEASAEAHKLLDGQTVRIETDPTQDMHDIYGRLLAYVFLQDGKNFDQEMIAEGYGREYTFKKPYEYQTEFIQVQANAKQAGKGLWGVCQ